MLYPKYPRYRTHPDRLLPPGRQTDGPEPITARHVGRCLYLSTPPLCAKVPVPFLSRGQRPAWPSVAAWQEAGQVQEKKPDDAPSSGPSPSCQGPRPQLTPGRDLAAAQIPHTSSYMPATRDAARAAAVLPPFALAVCNGKRANTQDRTRRNSAKKAR